mmetsp:Transcript_100797/g.308181  ORF Transcript_100797/g.308181 Transcript_100797/m.308181 type:complete len:81 (-) Transcript_100797:176-418(-)
MTEWKCVHPHRMLCVARLQGGAEVAPPVAPDKGWQQLCTFGQHGLVLRTSKYTTPSQGSKVKISFLYFSGWFMVVTLLFS